MNPFQILIEATESCLIKWNEFYDVATRTGLKPDHNLIPISHKLANFSERIVLILDIVKALKLPKENSAYLINSTSIASIKAALDNISATIDAGKNTVAAVPPNGGFQSFDENNLNILCKNGQAVSLRPTFINTNSYLEQILTSLSDLAPFSSFNNTLDLQQRTSALRRLISTLERREDDLKEIESNIKRIFEAVSAEKTKISQLFEASTIDARGIIEALQKGSAEASTKQGEISSKIAQINEILKSSASLDEQVKAYAAQFDAFKKQMQERLSFFEGAIQKSQTLDGQLSENAKKVDTLITKSEELLTGATKIGLSKSFADRASEYNTELSNSRKGFYFSIGLLIVSSLPLAFYILKFSFSSNFPYLEHKEDILVTVGGIFARLILLVPATWLTTFNTRRYSHLFRLRETYYHKASIAQSIYGFKQEAPQFAQEITAGVFLELNKPAEIERDSKEKTDSETPNKLLKIILDKVESVFKKADGK